MIKLFVTGDNHFGKKYDRYPDVRDLLIRSRFDCLKEMVRKAEEECCDLFVITGDLFDNINSIKVGDVKHVVQTLSEFNGTVLVLPGNHDYYTGEEKVWKDFDNALSAYDHNLIFLNEFKPYPLEIREEKVVIYPAYCQSKHSKENNLGWIRNEKPDPGSINIGIAHGAIKGLTPDLKEEYFLMSESELMSIPADLWLIGHTHIPYPADLDTVQETFGYRIFNPGTHEQTDLSNNTEGDCFLITVEKNNGIARVGARKYISGKIRYFDLPVVATADVPLAETLRTAVSGVPSDAVIRIRLSGTVSQADYQDRKRIQESILGGFLTKDVKDDELSEEITIETIRTEFAETSFAARFLESFMDEPVELQMAYQLLQECKES